MPRNGILDGEDGRKKRLDKLEIISGIVARVEAGYGGPRANPVTLMKARMKPEFIWDEIEELIIGRHLDSLDIYSAKEAREGRGKPLSSDQREAMWAIHQAFTHWLSSSGWTTWARVRANAAAQAEMLDESYKYDAIFIDEAQDMDSNASRMLSMLCKSRSRVFLAGDRDQSIYGVAVPWSRVHPDIDVRYGGRTTTLDVNYRSTEGIRRAVDFYLRQGGAEEEAEVPQLAIVVNHNERLPIQVRIPSPDDEIETIRMILFNARIDQKVVPGDCAVLIPGNEYAMDIAESLTENGLRSVYSPDKQIDLSDRGCVKVITQHSAKGLEFSLVIVAGFGQADQWRSERKDADDYAEILNRHRRRIAMSMSRAREHLYVILPSNLPTPLTIGMRRDLWKIQDKGGQVL